MFPEYVDALIEETKRLCKEKTVAIQPSETQPKPLSSQHERPDKATAIKGHKSRFSLP